MTSQALQTKEGARLTRSLFSELSGASVLGRMAGAHVTLLPQPLFLRAAFSGAVVLNWGALPRRGPRTD